MIKRGISADGIAVLDITADFMVADDPGMRRGDGGWSWFRTAIYILARLHLHLHKLSVPHSEFNPKMRIVGKRWRPFQRGRVYRHNRNTRECRSIVQTVR